jgi:integrase
VKGIRRHGLGYQASVYVAGAGRRFEPFPIDTPEAVMVEWQETTRARLMLQRGPLDERPAAGTFAADVSKYLLAVKGLPDYAGRVYDMALWVSLFGSRRSLSLEPYEIRTQRDDWHLHGPKKVYRKGEGWRLTPAPLAASTVNHRLRALENFFTVMYPQQGNPVRDVPELDEPSEEGRGLPYEIVEAILSRMPDRGRSKKGVTRPMCSKTKVRLRVEAYAGLTHAQVASLTRADIDLETPAVRPPRRQKGRPGKKRKTPNWRPLVQEAREPLKAFIEANAFGAFSGSAAWKSFQLACEKLRQALRQDGIELPAIRPTDLRHSYGTAMLRQTGNLKTVQHLMGHASEKTTERYAKAAIPQWLAEAVAKVELLRQPIAPNPET